MTDSDQARAAFDAIRAAIDAAVAAKSESLAFAPAEAHGLVVTDESAGFTQASKHIRTWPSGPQVELSFRSYDTSRTFSTGPDVNRFRLKLSGAGVAPASHSNAYYD